MNTIKINFQEATNIGLKRKANEDSHGHAMIEGYGHVFVVCDGMGGHVGGKTASQTAVECIIEYFRTHKGGNPNVNIHEALKFANTQIYAMALNDPSLKGMGTTCVVAIVQDNGRIYYGHVGDSRIYLNTNGKLIRITKDHSFVQYLVDSNQISEEEAEQHPNKNQILRALGIDETVEPEIPDEPLCPTAGDTLLLCTDGLCGMTTEKKMDKVLNDQSEVNYVEKLIQLALDGGGNDNVTAVVLKVQESPFSKTTYSKPKQQFKSIEQTVIRDPFVPSLLKSPKIKAMLVVILLLLAGIFYMNITSKKGSKKSRDKNQVSGTTENGDDQEEDDGWFNSITIFKSSKDEETEVKVKTEKKEVDKEDKSKNLKPDSAKVSGTIAPSKNESKEQEQNNSAQNKTDNQKNNETIEKKDEAPKTEAQTRPNGTTQDKNTNNNNSDGKEETITLDDKFKPVNGGNSGVWKEACDFIKRNNPKYPNLTPDQLEKLNPKLRFDQVKPKAVLRVK